MPKDKKRDSSGSSSDSDSGPDDIPPPKKSKKDSGPAKKNDQGDTFFELDGQKRVTVREFKGRVFVDIREHYEKDGKWLPGKKGISLSTSQWSKVKSLLDDIDTAVEEIRG